MDKWIKSTIAAYAESPVMNGFVIVDNQPARLMAAKQQDDESYRVQIKQCGMVKITTMHGYIPITITGLRDAIRAGKGELEIDETEE